MPIRRRGNATKRKNKKGQPFLISLLKRVLVNTCFFIIVQFAGQGERTDIEMRYQDINISIHHES